MFFNVCIQLASFSRRLGEEASSSSLAVSLSSRLAKRAEIQAICASPTPIFSLREMEGYYMRYDVKEKPYSL